MELIIPKDTTLYHGSCDRNLVLLSKPTWFAFDKKTVWTSCLYMNALVILFLSI